jgi:hypothetical protein
MVYEFLPITAKHIKIPMKVKPHYATRKMSQNRLSSSRLRCLYNSCAPAA